MVKKYIKMIILSLLMLGGIVVGLIILWHNDPTKVHFYPPCVFNKITGLNCPGCGSTRAMFQIVHGNFLTALRYNALIFVYIFLIGFIFVAEVKKIVTKKKGPAWKIPSKIINILVVVVLVYWVIRNIPMEPFYWLSPPK